MNAAGTLVWCAVQVSAVTVVVLAACLLARRSSPVLRAGLATAGVTAVLGLSALAFVPLPNWWDLAASWDGSPAPLTLPVTTERTEDSPSEESSSSQSNIRPAVVEAESVWSAAWAGFVEGLQQPPAVGQSSAAAVPWWPRVLLGIYLFGLICGMLRLLIGWGLVRREVRRARPIWASSESNEARSVAKPGTDRVQAMLDELAGNGPHVSVRVTQRLQSAVTTGWRRPTILLPAGWQEWSDNELRAVLAHELAHVHRSDWLTTLAAELTRSLHFYHPLVHWLAARLRLDQELAADAAAAEAAGGQRPYLRVLASMALAQSAQPVRWPARAFLPSRHTFMRRIEMLRDGQTTPRRLPRWLRVITWAAVLAVTVVAAGFRGRTADVAAQPPDAEPTASKDTQQDPKPAENQADLVRFVPAHFPLFFAADLATLRGNPALRQVFVAMDEEFEKAKNRASWLLVVPPQKIEQLIVIDGPGLAEGWIVRTNADVDGKVFDGLEVAPETEQLADGTTIYHFDNRFMVFAEPRTVLITQTEKTLSAMLAARRQPKKEWAELWEQVSGRTLAGMYDMEALRPEMDIANSKDPTAQVIAGMFQPILERTERIVWSIDVSERLDIRAVFACENERSATTVADTVEAAVTLSKNMLEQQRTRLRDMPLQEAAMISIGMKMGEEVLENIRITTSGSRAVVSTGLKEAGIMQTTALLLPAIQKSREAAQRTVSKNNLKQIALAMHNYNAVHDHFPPAVVIGPDGKTPHSWRVELLPFLEANDVYEQYKMDEPWDSEHNRKLLDRMPAVFRHPLEPTSSTNTSYFALVGERTAYGPEGGKGSQFREFTDGTSNTLLTVEAKRNIPWTKPEDIAYDRAKKLAEFGGYFPGGFHAALADGSVRFISESIDEQVLRNLIERNDGNVVEFPANPPRGQRPSLRDTLPRAEDAQPK